MSLHKIDKTSKVLTIIGLVIEGISAVTSIVGGLILKNAHNVGFLQEAYETIPAEEEWIFDLMTGVIGSIVLGIGIIISIVVIINIVLFSKLIRGEYTEDKAANIYKYQIIWGIISLFMNTLTGILYLVSGFQGHEAIRKQKRLKENN